MRSSADPVLDTVVRTIIALERSCLVAEAALVERRWPDLDAAFNEQVALTGELAQLFETAPETSPANDVKVAQRVRGLLAYRSDQLRRLEAYRDEVGNRLRSVGKLNAFSRSIGRRGPSAQLLDGQY